MSQLETVKVVRKDSAHGYKIINKADYDPKKHTLFKGKEADQAEPEGGLTRTEIIADLEGMGLEFDPRHSHAELLAQRNAGRAQRAAA